MVSSSVVFYRCSTFASVIISRRELRRSARKMTERMAKQISHKPAFKQIIAQLIFITNDFLLAFEQ